MLKIELYNYGSSGEPTASFATDAEIEIADQLRHQLEERYLAPSPPSSPSQERSGEATDSSTACRVALGLRLQRTFGGLKQLLVRRNLKT